MPQVFVLVMLMGLPGATSERELLEVLRSRNQLIDNLAVSYTVVTDIVPDLVTLRRAAFPDGRVLKRTQRQGVLLVRKDDRYLWEGRRREYDDRTKSTAVLELLRTGQGFFAYSPATKTASVSSSRRDQQVTPLGLMGTIRGRLGLMTMDSVLHVEEWPTTNQAHLVVTLRYPDQKRSWARLWLDPEKGYRPAKHEYLTRDGRLAMQIEDVSYDRHTSDCADVWLPRSGTIYTYDSEISGGSSESRLLSTTRLRVLQWRSCQPLDQRLFDPVFPAGTRVRDTGLAEDYSVSNETQSTTVLRRALVEDLFSALPEASRWSLAAIDKSEPADETSHLAQNPQQGVPIIPVHSTRLAIFILGALAPGLLVLRLRRPAAVMEMERNAL